MRKRLESSHVWGLCLGGRWRPLTGPRGQCQLRDCRSREGGARCEVKSQGEGGGDTVAICPRLWRGWEGDDCPVDSYPSVSRGVLSVPRPDPVGVRASVTRHCSMSCAVTSSSQLLVWATSSQAGSQAPVCSLELSREDGCQDPKAEQGSRGK